MAYLFIDMKHAFLYVHSYQRNEVLYRININNLELSIVGKRSIFVRKKQKSGMWSS